MNLEYIPKVLSADKSTEILFLNIVNGLLWSDILIGGQTEKANRNKLINSSKVFQA